MKTAYNKLYLDDARDILGCALDYATNDLQIDINLFLTNATWTAYFK